MSVILKGKNPRKPHTVRYWVDGKQREKSFATAREARDWKTKVDYDTRAQIFIDDKLGREDFGAAVDAWVSRLDKAQNTLNAYRLVADKWVKPTFAGKTVAQVANERDRATDLLVKDMGHLSITRRRTARTIVLSVMDEAVKGGKLPRHFLGDIEITDSGSGKRTDFVFPSFAQVSQLADALGIVIWLMRGCGLRIEEALAVHREDFYLGGKTLRISGQATRDGRSKVALKSRKAGEYRDVPVPGWLWAMVKDLPEGPLCPGRVTAYKPYESTRIALQRVARQAGILAGFRAHSLRHSFASTLLSRGVPITDVARWLGHRNINETYKTYSHFMPEAEGRAVSVLDAEYAEWAA